MQTGAPRYTAGCLEAPLHCTFIHAADLHLDTPFEGLREVRPHLRDLLRDASLLAWDRLVEVAVAKNVDFVVLAGDLYDGPERGLRAQLRFFRGLERLSAAGIWTFMVHGNHDPVEQGWSAIRQWPDRVCVFPADRAMGVRLPLREGSVHVWGTSYGQRKQETSLLPRFLEHPEWSSARQSDPQVLHVATLHASVGSPSGGHAPYSPCSLAELQRAGADYWALGHIHRRHLLHPQGPRVAYPGNLQGRSFKPSEQGEKGALLVEHSQGKWSSSFVDLAPVRFESIELDISRLEHLPEVHAGLLTAAEARRVPGRQLLLRGELVGRSPLSIELLREGRLGELHEALRDTPVEGLEWVDLQDHSRPPWATPEALARATTRDDLAAALIAAAERLRTPQVREWLGARDPALRSMVMGWDEADLQSLLEEALLEGLDLLQTEEAGA